MKPILLHYYVTNRCNAKCSFCTIWEEKNKLDAKPEDVKNNLEEARELGCKFIDFTGGEPLLNKNLPEFLEHAKRLGFITSVTTNTMLFKKKAKELDSLIDLLHFSMDSGNREMHNKIHGVNSFDSILESIPVAKENNLYPDILFTYTNENIDTFPDAYNIARENNLVIILDPLFNTEGNDLNSKKTHKKASEFSKLPGVYRNRAFIKLRNINGNNTKKSLCKAVETTIVILSDNKLALPCYHHRTESLPINGNLRDIFNSKERKIALRYQGQYPFCENCHINCYFDPSLSTPFNPFFTDSFRSKLRYAFYKYIVYRQPTPQNIATVFKKR